jgi:hypothetical protein
VSLEDIQVCCCLFVVLSDAVDVIVMICFPFVEFNVFLYIEEEARNSRFGLMNRKAN